MSIQLNVNPGLLLKPGGEQYPYELPSFFECWWQEMSSKLDIPYKQHNLLIYRKTYAKGLLKLHEARIAGWHNAWSQDLTADRVQELEALQSNYGWDYFRITWNESRREQQQFQLLKDLGYTMMDLPAPPQYAVDISAGYAAYLDTLSHNGRKSLRKKVRKAQAFNARLISIQNEADIEPFCEELFSYHIPYWTKKVGRSYFSDAEERNFLIAWCHQLYQAGQLRLDRLVMDEQTVNLGMRIVIGDQAYYLLTINTGLYQDEAPGIVAHALRIEELANEGVQFYNFGSGDYFYKVQSANRIETCHETVVFNPKSLKAKAYRTWLAYKSRKAQSNSPTVD